MNRTDEHVSIEDDQVFDINLGEQMFGGRLDNFTIDIKGQEHDIAVNPDLFPLYIGGDLYNAHLRYSTDGIELIVIKNGESRNDDHDGVATMEVDDLDEAHGDLAVLYLISVLRKV